MSEERCFQGFKDCCKRYILIILLFIILVVLVKELNKSQKSFLEIEGDPNNNLEEMTSQRELLLSQLQELKEENQNLAEKLRNAEAALQMQRTNKKNPEETSSALPGPQIYSLLLGLCPTIALLA